MKKKLIQFIPLAVLVLQMIYCIYVTSTTSTIFGTHHQAALIALCVCLLLTFLLPGIGALATVLMLMAGTANLISFTPATTTFRFGYFPWLQSFSLGVFILWIICNFSLIKEFFRDKETA